MTKSDYFELTISLGERALGYLKFNTTPAIPKYYELWYTYAGGQNRALLEAIQEILSTKEKLSLEETERLYDMFLSPYRLNEQVENVGSKISHEIEEIMKIIGSAACSTTQYGNSLEAKMGTLDDVESVQQLKKIISGLVLETNEVIKHTREIEARHDASRKQIAELNSNLEAIRTESMTDQLTGIANRKRFDYVITAEMAKAKESGNPLCLLIADIDFFKKFNDTYGHQTGDQVLRLVAHTLKANVKGQDLAARYGGEEFAVILPKTSLKNAVAVAEQIRNAVMSKELVKKSTGESLGRVKISVGVALYRQGETKEEFFQRADTCLYAAKHAGRNQVKCETDPDIDPSIAAA